jgi:hypothetical protein
VAVKRPLLDDHAPYVFRTRDFGRTWTKIVNGIAANAYVHAVREDPTRRGLLYAATQHGVYVSYDDGGRWHALNPGLPDLPIVDLLVEGNELVISAHGRGFWVLDNIAPLRQATAELASLEARLFTPPSAVRSGPAVTLSWWLKTAAADARLEIVDGAGEVLRTLSAPAAAGLNRTTWDLRANGYATFPGMILWGARSQGPAVPPGEYTVRLSAGGHAHTVPLRVERNPLITDVSDDDLRAQYAFSRQVRDKVTEANQAVIAIRQVKAQLQERYGKSDDARLRAAGDRLLSAASAVEESIYQVRNQSGQDPLNFPIKVNNRLANLMAMAERGDGRPGSNLPEIFGILTAELKGYTDRLERVWGTELAAANRELGRLGLAPLDPACDRPEGCAVR